MTKNNTDADIITINAHTLSSADHNTGQLITNISGSLWKCRGL